MAEGGSLLHLHKRQRIISGNKGGICLGKSLVGLLYPWLMDGKHVDKGDRNDTYYRAATPGDIFPDFFVLSVLCFLLGNRSGNFSGIFH